MKAMECAAALKAVSTTLMDEANAIFMRGRLTRAELDTVTSLTGASLGIARIRLDYLTILTWRKIEIKIAGVVTVREARRLRAAARRERVAKLQSALR